MSSEKSDDDKKTELAMDIQGGIRTIRFLSDQMNYYAAPTYKAGIFAQMEMIRDLLMEGINKGWWKEMDIDLSEFGRAYSDFSSMVSSIGSSLGSAERKEFRKHLRDFLRAATYIEFTLRGAKLEEWHAEEEAEGGMSADELMEMLT